MLCSACLNLLIEVLLILLFRYERGIIFCAVLFIDGSQIVVVLNMLIVTLLRVLADYTYLGLVLGYLEIKF